MKFYMTPGSCSTGIHILLEEIGLVFEAHVLNLPRGDHLRPDYLAINPQGTIPTLLLDDGTALTDFIGIATWLAQHHPRRKLLPDDPAVAEEARAILDFCTRHIHGEGFRRVFTPERYAGDRAATVAEGRAIAAAGLEAIGVAIAGRDYAVGPFSIADAALFYVEFWADKTGMTLPPNCLTHYQRMKTRPAVAQVLAEEGYR
jgi:glutathione S-transferase